MRFSEILNNSLETKHAGWWRLRVSIL